MSCSSEEVLLIVGHVRHKKSDGSLYMMGQRMAWMQQSKDTFSISHNFADIKIQKISPDSKAKVQLQVVMHDGGADTFHFINPIGRDAQVQDREGVKELLQQLLPKFRNKVNSELEEKNRMLQSDPELFQLYKDLVVSGIVSAEEFWANRVQQQGSTAVSNKVQQEVGVSPAFLADIRPQMDGCNGLKYNLTADIIGAIFRTYPEVKKKHMECVPDKLTEADFWTRFFQSHYFHRDRINMGNKDLFAECAKTDEQSIKRQMEEPPDDPFLDLSHLSDHNLGEGYGTGGNTSVSINGANASLIRRFNQHSTMVLKACIQSPASGLTPESQTNGATPDHTNSAQRGTQPPASKKIKLEEKLAFADLEVEGKTKSGPVLRLKHAERFLHGPTPAMAAQYTTSEEMLQAQHTVRQEMELWQPALSKVLASSTAMSTLIELSPGGSLMKTFTDQQLHQLVGEDVEKEVRNTYSALTELLRHFWACFPTSTTALEEKAVRMYENLKRFHHAMLDPIKEKLTAYHYHVNLTSHMEEMLAATYTKFNSWQTRRMNRK